MMSEGKRERKREREIGRGEAAGGKGAGSREQGLKGGGIEEEGSRASTRKREKGQKRARGAYLARIFLANIDLLTPELLRIGVVPCFGQHTHLDVELCEFRLVGGCGRGPAALLLLLVFLGRLLLLP